MLLLFFSKYGSSNNKQLNLLINVYNHNEFHQNLNLKFEPKIFKEY